MTITTIRHCDRTGWDPGPWDQEPDRVEWTHHGVPCMAIRNQWGTWCGYAGVGPGHRLYQLPFNATVVKKLLEVHGGVTYSSHCTEDICHTPEPGQEDDSVWWFGFDCCHICDLSPALQVLCRNLSPDTYEDFGTYRDLAYVKAETQALADQLNAIR